MLCENPGRRTGLSTLFHELVAHSLRIFPDLQWLLFAGSDQPWELADPRVEVVRRFPANNHRLQRLWADHFRVGPLARARGADLLLTVGFVPLAAPLPVAMQVFSLHHLRMGGGLRSVYRRRAVGRGMDRAALIVANSQWTADRLLEVYPSSAARLVVSPEGVQHERFSSQQRADEDEPARLALNLPSRYLLWSSNFYPYKRAELALHAYAELPREVRLDLPLVLIGGDWEGGLARAQAKAAQLGVTAHTRFLGWIDDRWLPACYRGARAHILSTAEETFGRSVLEAMACGCPCVLQDLPVLREVTGGAALFCDFTEARSSGAAFQRICTDDRLVGELRTAGLARAAAFSFERLARERIGAIRARLKG